MHSVLTQNDKEDSQQGPFRQVFVVISQDYTLTGNVQLKENSVLKFENGAKLTADSQVTLKGYHTFIDAPLTTIFDENIKLEGSFANAEWPVEWWGGQSTQEDASPIINHALHEIANTTKQATLLLTGRYKIQDTIYMQPGVALSGTAKIYSYNYLKNNKPARGALLLNFNENTAKWAIDCKYENEATMPVEQLYDNSANLDTHFYTSHTGCNITNLHIFNVENSDNGNSKIFGGIRLHSIQAGTIENVDIEANVLIGIALVANVWFFKLNNIFIKAYGCPLYMGRACTFITAVNVACRSCGNDFSNMPFRLIAPDNQNSYITPIFRSNNTFPPYWNANVMNRCGIIMEGAHSTFMGCSIEFMDAVICGSNYTAKFISPYIENIYYFFGWLFAAQPYSIPSHKAELIIEDIVQGFETFPSIKTDSNNKYLYLEWVDCSEINTSLPLHDEGSQISLQINSTDNNPEYLNTEIPQIGYYRFLPTFGTIRGVVKAHNVGRATCWQNGHGYRIEENGALVSWDYPSYYIYVSPGLRQRNFYYDYYKVMKEITENQDGVRTVRTWVEDKKYCKYKKIIIESTPSEAVRYFFDDTNDAIYYNSEEETQAHDNKAEVDIYKRQLQLGVSDNTPTTSGELFERGLDNFIMTPKYGRTWIDYGGTVKRKRFTIEIINAAYTIRFRQPLHLHNCKLTFKNSYSANAIFANNAAIDYLMGLSGDCTITFEGSFGQWGNVTHKMFKLVGDKKVNLKLCFTDASTAAGWFSNPANCITNFNTFTPGCDVDIDII